MLRAELEGLQQAQQQLLDPVARELLTSYQRFIECLPERSHLVEVDTCRVDPSGLVGPELRIYWQNDDAWYLAHADALEDGGLRHRIKYKDGESQALALVNERVRSRWA